jgi:Flp pilus assembly protein TadG
MQGIRRIAEFLKARAGMVAVEFAMIAPILIAMAFGTIELAKGLDCHSKISSMATAAADITAQATEVKNADMTNLFAAATAILYPNSTSSLRIVVSSVVDDGKGGNKVAWSDANNGSARTVNSSVALPAGVLPTGGSVIVAEVTYVYTSPLSYEITGPITISRIAYATPRLSSMVQRLP